jgi:hypothetical protein
LRLVLKKTRITAYVDLDFRFHFRSFLLGRSLISADQADDITYKFPQMELGLRCRAIRRQYHSFLSSTVNLLYEIQERQMKWNWKAGSPVLDGLAWLQSLWASRKAVCLGLFFSFYKHFSFYIALTCDYFLERPNRFYHNDANWIRMQH